MKNQMTASEKQQLVTFIENNDGELTVDYWMDHGVQLDLPGHSLWIANEGSGWGIILQSNYDRNPIVEEYNIENLEDLIEDIQIF